MKITSSDLRKEVQEGASIQSAEGLPTELGNTVIPVMEVNPKLLRRVNFLKRAALSNAATASIFTAVSDRDTYITAASLTYSADVTATTTSVQIEIVVDGATIQILNFARVSLQVQNGEMCQSFVPPIKIDRGSAVIIRSGTAVANIVAVACIQGYIVHQSG